MEKKGPISLDPSRLTERQQALIEFIGGLDPDLRHTLHIECRGAEPWSISKVKEHTNLRLGPKSGGG